MRIAEEFKHDYMNSNICSRGLKNILLLVVAMIALFSVAGCKREQPSSTTTTPAKQRAVTVAAAAELKYSFDDIVAAVGKVHPEGRVKVTYCIVNTKI